ncbi:hypothetical protein LB571_03350 [Mesorhizobium sp. BR1-1-4]|nr:hypothetical protein [Mesorhizobium sp. BR1-1-4]
MQRQRWPFSEMTTSRIFEGCNLDFKEREQLWMEEARAFWTPALAAAIAADPSAMENADAE